MNEESPMAQQEWIERLSAYLDGEVDEAEREEIERVLATRPDVAEELAQLERVRGELRAWHLEAPGVPDALIELLQSFGDSQPTVIQYRRRTLAAGLRYAAVLLAGLLLGMAIARSNDSIRRHPGTAEPLPAVATAAGYSAIPSDAAEVLLREVAVSAKKERVESLVRQGRYEAAAREYDALEKDWRTDGAGTARGTVLLPRELQLWRAFQQRRRI